MAIPTYTKTDLANFANEDVSYYTSFADVALAQASLLFKLATCLKDMPSDSDEDALAKNAILSMAESIYETDKYKEAKFSPFSSETIGSYSYTISLAKIKNGEDTGIMWFDLAVGNLGVCDWLGGRGASSTGGIEVFEHDGTFVPGDFSGNERLLSPNDLGEYPNTNFWS